MTEEEGAMHAEGRVADSATTVKLHGVNYMCNTVGRFVLSRCWKAFDWKSGMSQAVKDE